MAVFVEDSFAFIIGEFAADPFKYSHEGFVIHQALAFQIQKLEARGRLQPLVLLDLGLLPDLLVNGDLQLLDPIKGNSSLEQPEGMDQQIDEELFSFQGDSCIHVFAVLGEFLLGQADSISRPVFETLFYIKLSPFRFFAETAHMGVLVNLYTADESCNRYFSIFLKLIESMIDGCQSLLTVVVPDVANKHEVVDSALVRKLILDGSDFLGGEEHSRGIEQKIESMFG